MGTENVKKYLETSLAFLIKNYPERQNNREEIELAIKALEKQTPKEPIVYTETRNLFDRYGNNYGTREVYVYTCPNLDCGMDIVDKWEGGEFKYKPKFCSECGQKLDWSREE